MKRKRTLIVKGVKEHCYMDSKYLELEGGAYEIPFATKPTEGKHSLESCENCRKLQKNLINGINEKFEEFPNCCEYHKKLITLDFFKKEDYSDIATITANKVIYTYHHIINHLDNDDWYNEIINYLEYTKESFGSVPTGCGEPFQWSGYLVALEELLPKVEDKVVSDKISLVEIRTRMHKVIKLLEPITINKDSPNKDFHLLMSKYEQWYKMFPFELPYFNHLKEKFKKIIPLHTGRTKFNKYLNAESRELHTKDSLSVLLLQITKNILASINGVLLFEKGLITNDEKHELDLIINNRKLELLEMSAMTNENTQEYIKVIKKWYEEEKSFIKEITPFLVKNKTQKNVSGLRPNRTDIAYYAFYSNEVKTLQTEHSFPSDKAWTEIGEQFSKNSKNIQVMYNSIVSNSEERLKKGKINNLEYVINNMLKGDEKALKLAKTELKQAKLKS